MLTTILFFKDLELVVDERERVHRPRGAVPLVHGAVRQLRRGDRRRPRQGAGRHAAQDPLRDGRPPASCRRHDRGRRQHRARPRRRVRRDRGRGDPERRRGHRGHRQRRRVGDHRRVGAGDPRVGRRPLGGHRRHAGAVRRDRRAHHRATRRDVHRPDDRARRGLVASEDAERDRAQHPARRAHDHLPARDRDAPAVRDVRRRRAAGRDPRRAARVPDPDDDRRAALGDRHRGHGPARAPQRARDERAGGGGGGRLRHAAARQDRHHHVRQPAGRRVRPGERRHRAGARRRRAALEPRRRDARGPLDRGARQGALRPPRARARRRHARRVHRADPHERRRLRGPAGAQGRGRLGAPVGRGPGRRVPRAARRRGRLDRGAGRHAARRRRGGRGGLPPPSARARRDLPEGHREAGHRRALRRPAAHGHPHRDDHRRQPAHRGGDRAGSRRRRLPRRGHARRQDGPHQARSSAAAASSR